MSPLEILRLKTKIPIPSLFEDLHNVVLKERGDQVNQSMRSYFPHTYSHKTMNFCLGEVAEGKPLRVGVVLSGGQAPGGHNVICALFDGLKKLHQESLLFGFLGGPQGIIEGKVIALTEEVLTSYRNTGGFDLIGSGRTKIESEAQLAEAYGKIENLKLDGLVIIGGDDSNTNAAILAEYLLSKGSKTCVVGIPKTIDGDLKNENIETSFGFDTASKTYSELIGNIARDTLSAKKYYHFIKLMGRSASHITLECALQVHPNLVYIGEEIANKKRTLASITNEIADLVCERSEKGKDYGIILIPEGLIEFIPEVKNLISEINEILLKGTHSNVLIHLSREAKEAFLQFPEKLQHQLLLDRDPHGNVQVSHIATEELLIHTVKGELKKRGSFKGKFSPLSHFFGYEGRAAFPSNFDATYCYALGLNAALVIKCGLTGYMSVMQKLTASVEEWHAAALPIVSMIHMEERKGKEKPVIAKALVDLNGAPFQYLVKEREKWRWEDDYRFPGPIQFFGPREICEATTITLQLEQEMR